MSSDEFRDTFSNPSRILVPIDGSDEADCALPVTANIARRHNADVIVLAVEHLAETSAQAREEAVTEHVLFDRADAELAGLHVGHRTETALPPAEAIEAAVRETGADLVVIATGADEGQSRVARDDVVDQLRRDGIQLHMVESDSA